MTVTIALAFSNDILCESVEALLDGDPALTVVSSAAGPDGVALAARSGAEVVVVDLPVLDRVDASGDGEGAAAVVVVDTGCDTATLAGTIIAGSVKGVLGRDSTPELLGKCVRAVAAGRLWLDQNGMRHLIDNIRERDEMEGRGKSLDRTLSDRERQVASIAGKGHSNREIAEALNISEQTVKGHLSSVYRKLGISSRSRLVTSAARKGTRHGLSVSGAA